VAVPISQASAAGGFILPGDRVDVLQAHQLDSASGGQKQFISQTVMHNVRVLAVDQTSQPPKNGGQSQLGAVATLEVNPTDAEVLIAAKAAGELTLDLRSYADAGGPSGASGLVRVGSVHIIRPGQAAADVTVTP
jgi:pilus assembly protein CpaB